jgi:hypothetical protein
MHRFGSAVVDRERRVTERCVVATIQLFHPGKSTFPTWMRSYVDEKAWSSINLSILSGLPAHYWIFPV